jgi:hypothetical protein
MFPIETFRSTLEKIIKILQAFQIRFHLTGGVTSIAYSEPRMTQDVDIVIDHDAVAGQLDSFIIGSMQFTGCRRGGGIPYGRRNAEPLRNR